MAVLVVPLVAQSYVGEGFSGSSCEQCWLSKPLRENEALMVKVSLAQLTSAQGRGLS